MAVPQATVNILFADASLATIFSPSPEKSGTPFFILPDMTFFIAVGSSFISFSIKCGYPPFSADSVSQTDTFFSRATGSRSLSKTEIPSEVTLAISPLSGIR